MTASSAKPGAMRHTRSLPPPADDCFYKIYLIGCPLPGVQKVYFCTGKVGKDAASQRTPKRIFGTPQTLRIFITLKHYCSGNMKTTGHMLSDSGFLLSDSFPAQPVNQTLQKHDCIVSICLTGKRFGAQTSACSITGH